MKKPNVRIKRPWIHHVIIGAYVLAPVANVLMVRLSLGVPVATIIQRLFRGYGPLAASWLLTAPLAGVALYFVHRWSWYVFLAHSSLVFADFVLKAVARPLFFWSTIPPANHLVILTGNLALVISIAAIIRRDFRSPYFQSLPRTFRRYRRVTCRFPVMLDASPAVVSDVSAGGCFAQAVSLAVGLGARVRVSFCDDTSSLTLEGRVMRVTPAGAGIMFAAPTHEQRVALKSLVRDRTAPARASDIGALSRPAAAPALLGAATGPRAQSPRRHAVG